MGGNRGGDSYSVKWEWVAIHVLSVWGILRKTFPQGSRNPLCPCMDILQILLGVPHTLSPFVTLPVQGRSGHISKTSLFSSRWRISPGSLMHLLSLPTTGAAQPISAPQFRGPSQDVWNLGRQAIKARTMTWRGFRDHLVNPHCNSDEKTGPGMAGVCLLRVTLL